MMVRAFTVFFVGLCFPWTADMSRMNPSSHRTKGLSERRLSTVIRMLYPSTARVLPLIAVVGMSLL